ncbi:uncharacterized protein LOC119128306 [Syngnathus acus]|uniref:uncharacterized protein LOC119128306 n=1 Tax=Syngnathus acus TaxID=161584 RepID=UPI00188623D2|nr:uncharacterized protein LOC119128306 [Syngnathus acus]
MIPVLSFTVGRFSFSHQGGDGPLPMNARSYGRRRGHSSLFPMEDERSFGEDETTDQGLGGLGSAHCFPHLNGERIERYSRKVFVGGLPPDIDEDEITASFRRFGHLFVDWPHKAESKSYFPPKGYAFLLFQDESSVQALIDACIQEDGKLYLCVSSPTIKDKPVSICMLLMYCTFHLATCCVDRYFDVIILTLTFRCLDSRYHISTVISIKPANDDQKIVGVGEKLNSKLFDETIDRQLNRLSLAEVTGTTSGTCFHCTCKDGYYLRDNINCVDKVDGDDGLQKPSWSGEDAHRLPAQLDGDLGAESAAFGTRQTRERYDASAVTTASSARKLHAEPDGSAGRYPKP